MVQLYFSPLVFPAHRFFSILPVFIESLKTAGPYPPSSKQEEQAD
jgi:hypothetical protein